MEWGIAIRNLIISGQWAIPEKFQTGGRLRIQFSDTPLEFLDLSTRILQNCVTPLGNSKVKNQARPLEIPH